MSLCGKRLVLTLLGLGVFGGLAGHTVPEGLYASSADYDLYQLLTDYDESVLDYGNVTSCDNCVTQPAVTTTELELEVPNPTPPSSQSAPTTTQVPPVSTTTPKASQVPTKAPKYGGICYVSESNIADLNHQITSFAQTLVADGDLQQSQRAEKLFRPIRDVYEGLKTICSKSRINQISQDLGTFASQLWSLANRLRNNISEAQVQELDEMKVGLIQRLQEIKVFSGFELTSDAIILQSFEVQVDHLKHGITSTLALFQSPRPSRPPAQGEPLIF